MVTVPVFGERVQVTAVLVVPLTEAVNWAVPPALRLASGGVSETATLLGAGGCNCTDAVAVFVVSALLVAVTVTDCALVTLAGAV